MEILTSSNAIFLYTNLYTNSYAKSHFCDLIQLKYNKYKSSLFFKALTAKVNLYF